jgi:hypothetical protein
MRELAGRLEALDPDAGAALKVIAYFDQLVEGRAGLESVVRGAAVLSGHPARLLSASRGLHMRLTPDGTRIDDRDTPPPEWCSATVDADASLWLEHPAPAGPVEAMVLERAAMAARAVLDRTRSRRPARRQDRELVEVLLDPAAPEEDRRRAAERLRLPSHARVHVTAALDGRLDVLRENHGAPAADGQRLGIGRAVAPIELAATVDLARTAARFTAVGDASDPGPRVVYAEDLGVLVLLAQVVQTHRSPLPDVEALDRASTAAPWMLSTLDAIARSGSVRAAAAALTVHHSTLQERLSQAEHVLGWSLREVDGQLRLASALIVRRLLRNG